MVGNGDRITDFDIWIHFPNDGYIPTIEVTRSHLSKNAWTLLTNGERKTMAMTKKCDICGILYEQYNYKESTDEKPNTIKLVQVFWNDDRYYSGDIIECCPKCMEAIIVKIKELGGEVDD